MAKRTPVHKKGPRASKSGVCVVHADNPWCSSVIRRQLSHRGLSAIHPPALVEGPQASGQDLSLMESVKHVDNGDLPNVV